MTKIDIDTTKMKECGTDMITLSLELKEQINGLFDALLASKNYWIGESNEIFLNHVNIEKIQYYKFANSLYKEGKFILESAQKIEEKIKELKW